MCCKTYDNYLQGLGENYLLDLITIFKHEVFHGINRYYESQNQKNNDKEEYFEGYTLAYSRVISLLIQQAEVYNIPLSELGLDDIEVEKD